MSQIVLSPNAAGTAQYTIAAPGTSTNRTLTLPDATTTLVGTDATQTLTNKTIQGGSLTLATAQASTSGTSIDFTGIPSWVKRITVMFSGVSTNGSSTVQLQIGSGSVSTSSYFGTVSYASGAGAFLFASTGFPLDVGNTVGAATLRYGALQLVLLNNNTWCLSGNVGQGSTGQVSLACAGTSPTLGGALDRVRITTVNGTDAFDAGSINIMYEG